MNVLNITILIIVEMNAGDARLLSDARVAWHPTGPRSRSILSATLPLTLAAAAPAVAAIVQMGLPLSVVVVLLLCSSVSC